ncbi:MAG: TIGR03663 family protein [Acidobacteriota bacterium]|nr:TIGR03663 family protein [Acidobacteriota bacterium]
MSEGKTIQAAEHSAEALAEAPIEKYICIAVFVFALLVGAWFRFSEISLRPFHHDEGVNGHFMLNLVRNNLYRYDPTNYHGPSLYYFTLVAIRVFGENDFALRLTPVLFGILTVAMVWLLRRQLGTIGTPIAAFCMALSPCLVFYSRYFIHEMSFGCFSLGMVVGFWRYAEDKKFYWLALGAVSTGLLLTTKETSVITVAVFLVAIICAAIWDIVKKLFQQHRLTPATVVKELRNDTVSVLPSLDHAMAATIIAVFIHVFFYSSLFDHWGGVMDFFRSIAHWTKERSSNDHVKIFWYYLGILLKLELPLLIGSLLAGVFIVWRGNRFWLFTGAWTFGMTMAYSKIPYKTPWLMISFVVPMVLVCGYAAEQLYRMSSKLTWQILCVVVFVASLAACWQISRKVNFEKYDDNGNETGYFVERGKKLEFKPYLDGTFGYVYAHTDREFLDLIRLLEREADKFPTKKKTGIYVASPEHWPLPWYLRDYSSTDYSGRWPSEPGTAPGISQPIILAYGNQQANLNGIAGWRASSRTYKLRPGVELLLFVRDEAPAPTAPPQ